VPNTELGALLGCATQNGAIAADDRQNTSQPDIFAAGECTGIGGKELAMIEGRIAARQAISADALDDATHAARCHWQRFADVLARTFMLDEALKNLADPDTIICRCEDVTRRDLDGETDWTAAKLQSRCGMGACQGRICGPATEFLYGWQRPSPRLPVFPTRIDTLAECRIDEHDLNKEA
jgi:NADPH-dependent 2,4-dienoyl-CoA reductase/sulfur reductase-like enzyme